MIKKVLVVLIMSLALVACKSQDSTVYRIVLDWTPNTNHTGLYVALEQKLFEKYGVNVEIVQPPEGDAVSVVASGTDHAVLGINAQDTLAPAFAKPADQQLPVTVVGAILQHNTSGIISLKHYNIETPKDLMGHTYGTWDSPVELAIIKKIMENDGGDFSQLSLVPNGATDSIAAMQTQFQSVWIFYGWDGIATELQGLQTNYINIAYYGDELDYYTPVLLANNDFLQSQPDTMKKMMNAITEGYTYAANHPDEAATILLKYAPELNEEVVRASQKWISNEYLDENGNFGTIDAQRWDSFYQWLNDNQLVDVHIPAGFGFTNDYLPQ